MLKFEFDTFWKDEIAGRWPEWAKRRTAVDVADWHKALNIFPDFIATQAVQKYRLEFDDLPKIPVIVKFAYAILNPPKPKELSKPLEISPLDMSPMAQERMMAIFHEFTAKSDNISMYLRSLLYKKCPSYRPIEPLGEDIVNYFKNKNVLAMMTGGIAHKVPKEKSVSQLQNKALSKLTPSPAPASISFPTCAKAGADFNDIDDDDVIAEKQFMEL